MKMVNDRRVAEIEEQKIALTQLQGIQSAMCANSKSRS